MARSLIERYNTAKQEAPDGSILFYKVGDYYEVIGDDAWKVANVLGLVVTTTGKREDNAMPMVGIPSYIMDGNIEILLSAGIVACFETDKV